MDMVTVMEQTTAVQTANKTKISAASLRYIGDDGRWRKLSRLALEAKRR